MTILDLNEAGPQRTFDLIPAGTIATVQMLIRNGGVGEGGWLKNSKDGSCEMLDCEFTVVDGEYAKRKIWQPLLLSGTTDGQAQAAEKSRGVLRAILESARDIKPDDISEAAKNKRRAEFTDFNNLRFIVRIGIEKSKDQNYPDKNKLLEVITPDQKQWKAVEQLSASAQMGLPGGVAAASAKPAQAITRPEWAQ